MCIRFPVTCPICKEQCYTMESAVAHATTAHPREAEDAQRRLDAMTPEARGRMVLGAVLDSLADDGMILRRVPTPPPPVTRPIRFGSGIFPDD